jgi:hypothetical protein
MADVSGWAKLGDVLGGDSELEYQKGLALGAQTQNAMTEARARVDKATAQRNSTNQLVNAGLPYPIAEASATILAAGGNLGDVLGALGKYQEQGFRATAANPDVPVSVGNRALMGVAPAPVEPNYAVGSHDFANKFSDAAPQPLGNVLGGGGTAAGIQLLNSFGFLGPDGRVTPGREHDATAFLKQTQRIIDAGGVPSTTEINNPFPAPGAGPGAGSAPRIPPSGLPAAGPAVAPATVAANAGQIAGAKKEGEMRAEAKVTLPEAVGELDNMKKNIAGLLGSTGFDKIYGARVGTDIGQSIVKFASQDAADASARRQQLAANAFTISIQKNRGLGQLSNAEGSKFTDAFTRATTATIGTEEAKRAWSEVLQYIDLIQSRLQQKATGVAPGGAAPATDASRAFATEAEAAAAGLAPGTPITVGGVSGTWQ